MDELADEVVDHLRKRDDLLPEDCLQRLIDRLD